MCRPRLLPNIPYSCEYNTLGWYWVTSVHQPLLHISLHVARCTSENSEEGKITPALFCEANSNSCGWNHVDRIKFGRSCTSHSSSTTHARSILEGVRTYSRSRNHVDQTTLRRTCAFYSSSTTHNRCCTFGCQYSDGYSRATGDHQSYSRQLGAATVALEDRSAP